MSDEPEVLDVSRCWDLIRAAAVGRIAAVVDARPVIRPVNVAVDHGTLLVRTGHGSLISTLAGQRAAFEADGTEAVGEDGTSFAAWSVIVEGEMLAVGATEDLLDTVGVPLFPWHSSPKPVFLRLVPDAVSGRRFPVVDEATWHTTLDDLHRTAPD